MLRAVIVDVDGTLYDLARVRRRMAWRLMRFAFLHPWRGWRAIRALAAFRRAQERMRSASGRPSLDQAAAAAEMCGCSADFVHACVERWMELEPLSAVAEARLAGVVECFEWMNRRGLPAAAVSDYDPRRKLRALGLDSAIVATIWAQQEDVGAFKPDPRGLLAAARRLGVAPGDAIYIGDREEVDGAAARAAGMPVLILGANCDWAGVKRHIEVLMSAEEKATSNEVTASI